MLIESKRLIYTISTTSLRPFRRESNLAKRQGEAKLGHASPSTGKFTLSRLVSSEQQHLADSGLAKSCPFVSSFPFLRPREILQCPRPLAGWILRSRRIRKLRIHLGALWAVYTARHSYRYSSLRPLHALTEPSLWRTSRRIGFIRMIQRNAFTCISRGVWVDRYEYLFPSWSSDDSVSWLICDI